MKRTPIRRVSTKRASQLREYSKLRKEFLISHPFDQVWLKENGYNEDLILSAYNDPSFSNTYQFSGTHKATRGCNIPRATEIHHKNKRFGSRLNDTTEWFAVSPPMHDYIEMHKDWARANGYLNNI